MSDHVPFWKKPLRTPEEIREEQDKPYLHGLTSGLYKAGTDYLLVQDFGGAMVTNLDGCYSEDEIRKAAEVIRQNESAG